MRTLINALLVIETLLLLSLGTSCAGPGPHAQDQHPNQLDAAQPIGNTLAAAGWPESLPADSVQPWEQRDARGYVIPPLRAGSAINADSIFAAGVERASESLTGVSDNGEAVRLQSTAAGGGTLSWAYYRLALGGAQPGVVSVDANLLQRSDGALSAYYVGLADYAAGSWRWQGPFADSHVRLSCAAAVADGADYLSPVGNLFVCLAAYNGDCIDVVGVAANPLNSADTTPPGLPANLEAQPIASGLELSWDAVADPDLAGYRLYYYPTAFALTFAPGVVELPYLVGKPELVLTGLSGTLHVRIRAVDISGNESALCPEATAGVLAGDPPLLLVTASTPSALCGAGIELTASGAARYDWDCDGNGVFEITDDTGGVQAADTAHPGLLRPCVRGHDAGGSSVICGGLSLLIGTNARPLADGQANPALGNAPLNVLFDGSGIDDDGTIALYAWDFEGDGTYDYQDAADPSPSAHAYTVPGLYNAKFRVTDDQGSWDVDTVAVQVNDPLNSVPVAQLVTGAGEASGNTPHVVHFDAGGSTDSDGTIVEYLWDFDGDGTYDTWSSGPQQTYTYNAAGLFDALVQVRDDAGAVDSASVQVEVNATPVVVLEAAPSESDAPLLAQFDTTGTYDSDGTIAGYEWDLDGNGTFNEPGTEAAQYGLPYASYTYDYPGCYSPSLRVTDDAGASAVATVSITAHGWSIVTVDSSDALTYEVGWNNSLAVVDGCPAISYHCNNELKYARATSSNGASASDWEQFRVLEGPVDDATSLAVVSGCPAISYYYNNYSGSEGLKYARAQTSTGANNDWVMVMVDDSEGAGTGSALAVVDGCPAISYSAGNSSSGFNLKYARSTTTLGDDSSDWTQVVEIDDLGSGPSESSLAVVNGNPAVCYPTWASGAEGLRYIRATSATGASWADWTQVVDFWNDGMDGYFCSLAVINGCPAISHTNWTSNELSYSWSATANGSSESDWQTTTLDSSGVTGWYSSLAMAGGEPTIAYWCASTGDLKLARMGHTVTVDSTGVVGEFASLAEVDGGIGISYWDRTNDSLKYAVGIF